MLPLNTKNLIVRDFTPEDAHFIVHMLNEPTYIHYIRDNGVRTIEDAHRYMDEKIFTTIKTFGFGYHVITLQDGTPIGQCGLMKRPFLNDPDIGFAFLMEYQNKGYGFEALIAYMASPEVKHLQKIHAFTSLENPGSQALLKKLGFHFEGVIKYDTTDDDVKLFTYHCPKT